MLCKSHLCQHGDMSHVLSQRSPSVDNPIVVAALMLVLIMQRNCTPES